MELDLFRSFLAVAEARSFSRAARTVHSTQPTLSRQIARLETELGVQLFERYGRHVECTITGELLLPLAQAIVSRTDAVMSLVREQAGNASSSVRFGAVGNVFALLLTPVLATFLSAYPRVRVELIERDDAQLEEAVTSGDLDCAVVTAWGSSRASSRFLVSEEILLLVPANHRLATRESVGLGLLARESILLPRPTMNAGNIVVDALRRAGVEPRLSYRANYPELIKTLVARGFGVAPMPKMLASPDALEGLVAIPFEERLARDLVFIYSRDHSPSATTRALYSHMKAGISGSRDTSQL